MTKFKIGDTVSLSNDALENYGNLYCESFFKVLGVFTFYCPAKVHYNSGTVHEAVCKGHPGFDNGAGSALYELSNFPFAVYEWEIN